MHEVEDIVPLFSIGLIIASRQINISSLGDFGRIILCVIQAGILNLNDSTGFTRPFEVSARNVRGLDPARLTLTVCGVLLALVAQSEIKDAKQ